MNNEKGQSMSLALLILALGALVITPSLGQVCSTLTGSRIYQHALSERYSADAGVEYGIWSLTKGELLVPQFTVNGKMVNVAIEDQGEQVYRIASTATSDDESSTTIEANVLVETSMYVDGDIIVEDGDTINGSAYATGNIMLDNNTEITGDAVAEGDMILMNNSYIGGDVSAGGSLRLENNAEIGTIEVIGNVCAGGDIYIDNNAIIYGNIYTSGNIELGENAIIKNDVYINGDIQYIMLANNASIEGTIYITGTITDELNLGSNAYVEGYVYTTGTISMIVREENILGGVYENYIGEYPSAPECPVIIIGGVNIQIQTWE